MARIYSPLLHVGSSMWMVGAIDNHTAKPLTREECDAVCERLNVERQPFAPADRMWALDLARRHAKALPESYYVEPFTPHEWVIAAVLEASRADGCASALQQSEHERAGTAQRVQELEAALQTEIDAHLKTRSQLAELQAHRMEADRG